MVKFVKDVSGDIIGKAAKLPYFMEIRVQNNRYKNFIRIGSCKNK